MKIEVFKNYCYFSNFHMKLKYALYEKFNGKEK